MQAQVAVGALMLVLSGCANQADIQALRQEAKAQAEAQRAEIARLDAEIASLKVQQAQAIASIRSEQVGALDNLVGQAARVGSMADAAGGLTDLLGDLGGDSGVEALEQMRANEDVLTFSNLSAAAQDRVKKITEAIKRGEPLSPADEALAAQFHQFAEAVRKQRAQRAAAAGLITE